MGISPEATLSELVPGFGSVSPFASSRDTLLLVEDDDLVAALVERILCRLPVQLVRASSAREAEIVFAEKRLLVGIAMIDCGLPDMDGRLLCQRLRRSAPQLPVLLTSGCASHALEEFTDGPTHFLPKPFFPGELRSQVMSLLNVVT